MPHLPFHPRHNEYKFHFISPFFNRSQHLKWINFLLGSPSLPLNPSRKTERKTLWKLIFLPFSIRSCNCYAVMWEWILPVSTEGIRRVGLHSIVLKLNKSQINFLLLITRKHENINIIKCKMADLEGGRCCRFEVIVTLKVSALEMILIMGRVTHWKLTASCQATACLSGDVWHDKHPALRTRLRSKANTLLSRVRISFSLHKCFFQDVSHVESSSTVLKAPTCCWQHAFGCLQRFPTEKNYYRKEASENDSTRTVFLFVISLKRRHMYGM